MEKSPYKTRKQAHAATRKIRDMCLEICDVCLQMRAARRFRDRQMYTCLKMCDVIRFRGRKNHAHGWLNPTCHTTMLPLALPSVPYCVFACIR
jgi:hypothetical protein